MYASNLFSMIRKKGVVNSQYTTATGLETPAPTVTL